MSSTCVALVRTHRTQTIIHTLVVAESVTTGYPHRKADTGIIADVADDWPDRALATSSS